MPSDRALSFGRMPVRIDTVRWVVLALIALVCAMWQYSVGSRVVLSPILPLALMAWVIVDGSDGDLLVRAWIVGLAQDLVDPGSTVFHALAAIVIALLYLPMRPFVFRKRASGWMVCAFIVVLVHGVLDRVMAPGGESMIVLLGEAILTALVVPILGWLLGSMPRSCLPVGRSGA